MKMPRHKAAFSVASAIASLLLDLASSGVSGAALPESHAYVSPQVQIKADGNAVTHSLAQVSTHKAEEADGDIATDSLAQEYIHRGGEDLEHRQQAQKLMRTETDEIQSTDVIKLEGAAPQIPSKEVDCSATTDVDPISKNFCTMLDGSNWQVSGKLERAVKKMHSLAIGVGKDVQQDALLQTLQGGLWDLWFCAKRITPKCFPSNSTEEKYQLARHQVWTALAELKKRAGVTPTRPPGPRVGIPAAVNMELSARTVGVKDIPSLSQPVPASKEVKENDHVLQHLNLAPAGDASMLQTLNATEDAINSLSSMLASNAVQHLDEAIRKSFVASTETEGVVTLHDDEAGNLKKFKDNLMILHECASMPECPADNCCNPSNPQDEAHATAFRNAYEAFTAIQQDERLEVAAYLDIITAIGTSTTYYPEGHALHTSTTSSAAEHVEKVKVQTKKVIEETVIEEDSTLKTAICVTSALVVISVLVLIAMSLGGKTGSKGEPPSEVEEWGEEGYGEEQY